MRLCEITKDALHLFDVNIKNHKYVSVIYQAPFGQEISERPM